METFTTLDIFLPVSKKATLNQTLKELVPTLGDYFKKQLYESGADIRTKMGIWGKNFTIESVQVLSTKHPERFVSPMEQSKSIQYDNGIMLSFDEKHSIKSKEKFLNNAWKKRHIQAFDLELPFDDTVATLGVQKAGGENMIAAISYIVYLWVLKDKNAPVNSVRILIQDSLPPRIGDYCVSKSDMKASLAIRQ